MRSQAATGSLLLVVLCSLFLLAHEMIVFSQSAEAPRAVMGDALTPAGRPARTESSKVSLSSLLFFDGSGAHQGLQSPSRNRRLRSRGRWGVKAALGAAASAAALVFLIALCAVAYFRAAPLQLTRRRLSEGGAPESSAGLAACGETSGDGAGDDVQGPLREEELGPPQAKKAKLEDGGHESDHEKGSQPQASTTRQEEAATDPASAAATASGPRSPSKPHISPEELMAAEALISLSGEPAPTPAEDDALLPGPAFQGQAQLPSAPQQHAPPSAAPEQQAPPSATHQQAQSSPALPHQAQSVLAFQRQGQPPPASQQQASATPELAPVSAAAVVAATPVIVPVVVSPAGRVSPISEQVSGPQTQLASVQHGAPVSEALPGEPSQEAKPGTSPSVREIIVPLIGGLEEIDPLAEWVPPPQEEAGGGRVLEHAFSRLPQVPRGDFSAYGWFFNPQRAMSRLDTPVLKVHWLGKLTTLLAKEQLSVSELRQVCEILEHVVGHLALHEGKQPKKSPSRGVETLGYRFLLLDVTVSSLQLLGVPASGLWWNILVSRISDSYRRPFSWWRSEHCRFNSLMLGRLTAAIGVLKTGRRPEPKDLVQIKRCLLCCTFSPMRFLAPGWNLWRQIDREFYEQFGGRPSQTDPAQPGPSHQSGS